MSINKRLAYCDYCGTPYRYGPTDSSLHPIGDCLEMIAEKERAVQGQRNDMLRQLGVLNNVLARYEYLRNVRRKKEQPSETPIEQ